MDLKIFKAYDIRGVYGDQFEDKDAYRIGAAFAQFIKKVSEKEKPKVVVGMDNRSSSESLSKELIKGITEMGVDVVNIGLSTTPLMYFAVNNYNLDGGINITASHNPPKYNGFKLVREKAIALSESTGINEIKELVLANNFVSNRKGSIEEKNPKPDYILISKNKENLSGIKIIIDTANSVSGIFISQMFDGLDYTHIFKELDGNFPNHEPDPLKKENVKILQEEVVKNSAQVGIAFDGDGDRVSFIDENGQAISSDLILALISSIVLKENKELKILYDIRSSNIVKEIVERNGGVAMPVRIGHSFIKARMKEEDAYLAAEYSGHFFRKQKDAYYEDPYFIVFTLIEKMKLSGLSLSQLIEPFKKYYHSEEVNFEVKDKEKILSDIKNKYSEGQISLMDGVRVDFHDWWLLVRGSNTEPLLRLMVEAKTKELMEQKIEEIRKIIT